MTLKTHHEAAMKFKTRICGHFSHENSNQKKHHDLCPDGIGLRCSDHRRDPVVEHDHEQGDAAASAGKHRRFLTVMKIEPKHYLVMAATVLVTVAVVRFIKSSFSTLIPASIAAYLP
jgi:hypothetical protein